MTQPDPNWRPRWYDEDWICVSPPDEIECKTCFHRERDYKEEDGTVIMGYSKAVCRTFPTTKPDGVLWHNEHCPYYLEDDNGKTAYEIEDEQNKE